MIRVCVAGATGWTGREIAKGVKSDKRFELTATVARSEAGGEVLGAPCYGSVAEAIAGSDWDVLIDYTHPDVVLAHTLESQGGQA